jgi:hypothetical protein
MYARVTSGELSPGDLDKFTRMISDDVIPKAEKLDGFTGGYWLADHETGKVLGITMFESEEALRESQAKADSIRQEASRAAGLPEPSFRVYEVVASVGGEAILKKAA